MKTEMTYKFNSFSDAMRFKDLLNIAGMHWHYEEQKVDAPDGIYYTTENWANKNEIVVHNIDPANPPKALQKIADFMNQLIIDRDSRFSQYVEVIEEEVA